MKYISAQTFREAKDMATDRGLKSNEWKWVPWEHWRRENALRGLVIYEEDLIGEFSEDEKRFWLRFKKGDAKG